MATRLIDPELEIATPLSGGRLKRLRAALRQTLNRVGRGRRRQRDLRLRRALRRRGVELAPHWERIATILLRFGGASAGNGVHLFCDGDQTLDELWSAIADARHRVWFETYIFEPDRVGRRTIEELTRAALRGCEVKLLFDAVGSARLDDALLEPLRAAGAQVESFNPVWRWRRTAPLFRRDHRKIVVIDDRIAFCGGMNVSEDYAGARYGNGRFRDCHMKLTGPCVLDLARVFLSSWHGRKRMKRSLPRAFRRAGETFVQVLASRGYTGRRTIQRSLRLTIRRAMDRCWITTPYFVPGLRFTRAINRAARRGVDVRILVAGRCDVPIVRAAAQHVYGSFLRHRVRIFEMFDCTLHAKTIAIDGLYSTVGSFNLDQWSEKRNLEVNVAMIDPKIAAAVEGQFQTNVANASEVTLATWRQRSIWRRIINWAAYQVLSL